MVSGIIIVGRFYCLSASTLSGIVTTNICEQKHPTTIKPYEILRFDEDFLISTPHNGNSKFAEKSYRTNMVSSWIYFYTIKLLGIGSTADPGTAANIRQFLSQEAYHAFYMAIDSVYKMDWGKESAEMTEVQPFPLFAFPETDTRRIICHQFRILRQHGRGGREQRFGLSLRVLFGADWRTTNGWTASSTICTLIWDGRNWRLTLMDGPCTNSRSRPPTSGSSTRMMYQGKIMLSWPRPALAWEDPMNLIGYTQDQWDWCKTNEGQMWNYQDL